MKPTIIRKDESPAKKQIPFHLRYGIIEKQKSPKRKKTQVTTGQKKVANKYWNQSYMGTLNRSPTRISKTPNKFGNRFSAGQSMYGG